MPDTPVKVSPQQRKEIEAVVQQTQQALETFRSKKPKFGAARARSPQQGLNLVLNLLHKNFAGVLDKVRISSMEMLVNDTFHPEKKDNFHQQIDASIRLLKAIKVHPNTTIGDKTIGEALEKTLGEIKNAANAIPLLKEPPKAETEKDAKKGAMLPGVQDSLVSIEGGQHFISGVVPPGSPLANKTADKNDKELSIGS